MTAAWNQTGRGSLRKAITLFAALMAFLFIAGSPAVAHKDEKHPQVQQTQRVPQAPTGSPGAADVPAASGHDHATGPTDNISTMEGMGTMDMAMDRSKMPFFERLLDWFGRLHPMVVHFPIAFFPAALFTAIVGRRRPAFAAPVQFLVVAGGILAPIAAAAGWVTGLSSDPEPILAFHRWLGVGIGVVGAGLGYWAWKRPWEDRGAGMILALTLMTLAIAVQGFLGAALTHGMDHLMF